jgi:hypothetical protein
MQRHRYPSVFYAEKKAKKFRLMRFERTFVLTNISDSKPKGKWDEAVTNGYHGSL